MRIIIVPALFAIAVLLMPSTAQAWCCKRIEVDYALGIPIHLVHRVDVFDVQSEAACLDTCLGLGACTNFFRKDAAVDFNNKACVSSSSACCERTHWDFGSFTNVYWTNDQEECNVYCQLVPSCTSVFKPGHRPDFSTRTCVAKPVIDDQDDQDTTEANLVKIFVPTTPTDPLKYANYNPALVINKVISTILLIVGSLALLMFIYGGLTWMTAFGDSAKVAKASQILIWATLGLFVIFLSYIAVGFLLETVVAI